MNILAMFILLLSMVSPLMGSCEENEIGVFCDGSAVVPQVYCKGAENDDKWICKHKNKVRCGCQAGFARQTDKKCVRIDQCVINYDLRELYGGRTNAQSNGVQTHIVLQENDSTITSLGREVLKVIQNTLNMYVVKISSEVEVNRPCVCLKSTFGANLTNGAERTLECYNYVASQAAHGSSARVTSNQTVISRKQHVDFMVRERGSQTTVLVRFATIPADVKHINREAIHVRGEFVVLEADDGCLLTALDKGNGEQKNCVLWNFNFATPSNENKCVKALSLCTTDMQDLTRHKEECEKYDASQKRQELRGNMEFLNQHHAS